MEINNVLLLIKVICETIRYSNNEIIYLFITGIINTKSGHITKIYNSSNNYHYSTFYKFIETAKWSYIKVHQRFCLLLIVLFRPEIKALIIDDYINYRCRKNKTVKGKFQYDHTHKPNMNRYVWGQNILIVAAQVNVNEIELTLPVFFKLVGKGQNKINTTVDLLKITKRFFETNRIIIGNQTAVFDAFFAKKKLIQSNDENFTKIFQVRKDTALYELPKSSRSKHKRGRKRKYGKKISVKRKIKLNQVIKINIYGKEHTIHYREYVCKARFLDGRVVKAVYLTFDDFDKIHLIISTDVNLSAFEIIKAYSIRFNVEHLINQIKNTFCLKEVWMQNPLTYCRMLYLKLWSIVITQLSVISNKTVIENYVKEQLPWRIKTNGIIPITAGIVQNLLSTFFGLMSYSMFLSKVQNIKSMSENNRFYQHTIT